MQVGLILTALLIFLTGGVAAWFSFLEHEKRAAKRFIWMGLLLPLPYLIPLAFDFSWDSGLAAALLALTYGSIFVLLIPMGKRKTWKQAMPGLQIDERNTMFSRKELQPGTADYETYYQRHPEHLAPDNHFRNKAGLLQPGATQYHPIQFAAAKASFQTISALRIEVDGELNHPKSKTDPTQITHFIKSWARKLGAADCGVTLLKPYHLYSVGGRAERRDVPVSNHHQFAIALTVEMDKDMVAAGPSGSIIMESSQQYLESGIIALQIATFIRQLGYEARAHIDGNYQVVCPLVAKDAGLGEIGRMGLLMTPKLGARARLAVVTTNLPLLTDQPMHSYPLIDFCTQCKKCAEACPSQAISFDDQQETGGVKRWQINQEACYTLWCTLGTDCGRCVGVCPYSHPNNLMHNMVRFGINNSSLFRPIALKLDDVFYGRKPATAPPPAWVQQGMEKQVS